MFLCPNHNDRYYHPCHYRLARFDGMADRRSVKRREPSGEHCVPMGGPAGNEQRIPFERNEAGTLHLALAGPIFHKGVAVRVPPLPFHLRAFS